MTKGILSRYDRRLSATYRTSAERAWQWSEENADRVIEQVRLDEVGSGRWYKVDPALDTEIREKFEVLWRRAGDGELDQWSPAS